MQRTAIADCQQVAQHRAQRRVAGAAADQQGRTRRLAPEPELAERTFDAQQRLLLHAVEQLLRELAARDLADVQLDQLVASRAARDRKTAAPVLRQHDVQVLTGDEVELFVRRQSQEHGHHVGGEPVHALDATRQALDLHLRPRRTDLAHFDRRGPHRPRAPGTAAHNRRALPLRAGRAAGRADRRCCPSRMRARHDEQCPPLQLCGRFRPARSAASRMVSPSSTMMTCCEGSRVMREYGISRSPVTLAAIQPATRVDLRQLRLATDRERERIVQRLDRALALAELLHQAGEQLIGLEPRTDGDARFEIAARLAVQLGARRELRARQQQCRRLRDARAARVRRAPASRTARPSPVRRT